MDWLDALILGIVQGLTEYLPVSSSGHLQIGHELLGLETGGSLTFDIVVHVATVLSTLVILWKEVVWIFRGLLDRPLPPAAVEQNASWWNRINDQQRYALLIIISMIPIGIVGVFFKDSVEELFSSIRVVGWCELLTAALLAMTFFYKPNERERLTPRDALIIGLAQACAVLPGLSRSGSTIGTGLLLGCKKETLAQFSFLMVIPPILGEALLTAKDFLEAGPGTDTTSSGVLAIGFVAAFVSGCFACKAMIELVKRAKLIWFAVYCAMVGLGVLLFL